MTERNHKGQWQSGQSGNPQGKPKGSGQVAALRQDIAAHLPDIIMQQIAKAKEGDTQAARLLLERVLPPLKPVELPIAEPFIYNGSLTEQAQSILQAIDNGSVTPTQGLTTLNGLGVSAKLKEVEELEQRIAELERNIS